MGKWRNHHAGHSKWKLFKEYVCHDYCIHLHSIFWPSKKLLHWRHCMLFVGQPCVSFDLWRGLNPRVTLRRGELSGKEPPKVFFHEVHGFAMSTQTCYMCERAKECDFPPRHLYVRACQGTKKREKREKKCVACSPDGRKLQKNAFPLWRQQHENAKTVFRHAAFYTRPANYKDSTSGIVIWRDSPKNVVNTQHKTINEAWTLGIHFGFTTWQGPCQIVINS